MYTSNMREFGKLIADIKRQAAAKAANTAEYAKVQDNAVLLSDGKYVPYNVCADINIESGDHVVVVTDSDRSGAYIIGR